MITKLFDIYKAYFLISLLVAIVLILANINASVWFLSLIVVGALLTPFLYELDFLIYAYLLEPSTKPAKTVKSLIEQKNYKGAFLYSHENTSEFESTVFRSILMVIGAFGVGFLLLFSFVNPLAKAMVLSFLLTSIYLQTLSFTNNSWRSWYDFIDFVPKEKFAKIFLVAQYFIYLLFLLRVF